MIATKENTKVGTVLILARNPTSRATSGPSWYIGKTVTVTEYSNQYFNTLDESCCRMGFADQYISDFDVKTESASIDLGNLRNTKWCELQELQAKIQVLEHQIEAIDCVMLMTNSL